MTRLLLMLKPALYFVNSPDDMSKAASQPSEKQLLPTTPENVTKGS